MSLFTKELIALMAFSKRAMWMIRFWFEWIACQKLKNERFAQTIRICMPKSESLPSLFAHLLFFKERLEQFSSCPSLQKSDCERFAQVAQYNRVTVSSLLRLFMTKERQERFALFHARIALSLFRSQKASELLENQTNKGIKNAQYSTAFVFIVHRNVNIGLLLC